MKTSNKKVESIDQYIAGFPAEVQVKLKKLRTVIKESAPEATEAIKYAMPTFVLKGNLIHFAAYKNHIGLYPAPTGIEAFKKELSKYPTSKGAVQFPLDGAVPFDLVRRIVKYRVKENSEKAKSKKKVY